jgi:hypothetical protein
MRSLTDVLDGDFKKPVCRLLGFKAHMSEPVVEIRVAEEFDPPVRNRTWVDQHRRRSHS